MTLETKICKRCGQDLPLSDYYLSSKKYVVGGCVKAIHSSLRHICKRCQYPKGWHLKYSAKNVGNFPVENLPMNK